MVAVLREPRQKSPAFLLVSLSAEEHTNSSNIIATLFFLPATCLYALPTIVIRTFPLFFALSIRFRAFCELIAAPQQDGRIHRVSVFEAGDLSFKTAC